MVLHWHIILLSLTVVTLGVAQSGGNTCVVYHDDQNTYTVCLHRTPGNKAAANSSIYNVGYPLEILSETMTTFLKDNIMATVDDKSNVYWIGLEKQNSTYRWEASMLTTSGYSNWAVGASRSYDCVFISGADGEWRDRECTQDADGFIYRVKQKPTAAPEMVTAVTTDEETSMPSTAEVTSSTSVQAKAETTTSATQTTTEHTTHQSTSAPTTARTSTSTRGTTAPTTPPDDSDVTTTTRTTTSGTAISGTSGCESNCEATQSTPRWLSIEERLPNASVNEVNTIIQSENLTANEMLLVQQWFEDNNVVTEDIGDVYQYTKEYLDTFDKIITNSDENTFEYANPAVFAEACNDILEQYAQRSNESSTRISLPNIESEVVQSSSETFTGYSSNFTNKERDNAKDYIAIKNAWVIDYKEDDAAATKIKVISTLYNTSDIEKFGNDDSTEIVSSMVSITVLVDDVVKSVSVEFGLLLDPPNTKISAAKEGFEIRREPLCVFWDPSGGESTGLWSRDGCDVIDRTETYVLCSCLHTTNFAILMQTKEIEISAAHESALSTLSLIGLGVSTVALIFTILILLCLPSLKSDRVFIHKHLVVALILAQCVFISTVAAVNDELSCKLVAILLHYFYLAVFTWMLIEGVHLYIEIVQVFTRFDGKSKTKYYIIGGWGIPLIIVGVSVAARWSNYGTGPGCWLSFDNGLVWAFLGPVALVIVTNFVILLMVVRVVFRASSARGKDESEYKHLTAALKGALFLLPLLGLTWVIGFMSVSKGTLVFQYLFVIFNSLQGLFIFLFYCAINKEVRGAMSRRFSRAALESGDSRSISLRAVAKLKSSKTADSSPVIRFNDTSHDTGIHSLDSRMMDENHEPVSASGIRVHSGKSESQQNLTRGDDNQSPFSPDYY